MAQAFELLIVMAVAAAVTVAILAWDPVIPWIDQAQAPVTEALASVAGALVATVLGHLMMQRRLNGAR